MSAYISKIVKARAFKFDDNMFYYCTQITFDKALGHAFLRPRKSIKNVSQV